MQYVDRQAQPGGQRDNYAGKEEGGSVTTQVAFEIFLSFVKALHVKYRG
ncbi:hypothetical protein ODS41_01170 [Pyrobaculum sp. 3827-6]|nr:hypothetical protein [Pyrobaculum sp. 3827-6]MCU7786541.1 hypothetical protein [Pyrobaculum sp. 3827-6]